LPKLSFPAYTGDYEGPAVVNSFRENRNMSDSPRTSGPQFSADRAAEPKAVRTTIVGGRPPGSGQNVGDIPRGIEVLVKKASVDPDFKRALLSKRADSADEIGLRLEPAEVLMLRAAPAEQIEAIIDRTVVPQEHRRVFLGKAAAAMLAALGLGQAGCRGEPEPAPTGIRPDEVPAVEGIRPDTPNAVRGIEPDLPDGVEPSQAEQPESTIELEPPEDQSTARPLNLPPEQRTLGIRPDRPPAPTGSRPDRP
jgi:hypothetical protein